MVFHRGNRNPNKDGNWYPGSWGAGTNLTMLGGGLWCERSLQLWPRKAIEHSRLGELFWVSLDNKNAESNSEDGGLACDVAEGVGECLKNSIRAICCVSSIWFKSLKQFQLFSCILPANLSSPKVHDYFFPRSFSIFLCYPLEGLRLLLFLLSSNKIISYSCVLYLEHPRLILTQPPLLVVASLSSNHALGQSVLQVASVAPWKHLL